MHVYTVRKCVYLLREMLGMFLTDCCPLHPFHLQASKVKDLPLNLRAL